MLSLSARPCSEGKTRPEPPEIVDPEGPSLISLAVVHFLLSGRASGHTMLAILLEQDHRQQVGTRPAPRRRVKRRRRLADLLASPAGEGAIAESS